MARTPTTATLSLDECEPNALPPVCVKCGAEATCEKEVRFTWQAPWIILTFFFCTLPVYILLVLALQKKRTVYLPVCDKHKGVWNWGGAILAFVLFSSMILGVGVAATFGGGPKPADVMPLLLVGVMLYFLVGIVVGAVVQGMGVRPSRITDDEVTLIKLSPAFVEALESQQDAEEAEYEARRAAKRAARDLAQ